MGIARHFLFMTELDNVFEELKHLSFEKYEDLEQLRNICNENSKEDKQKLQYVSRDLLQRRDGVMKTARKPEKRF